MAHGQLGAVMRYLRRTAAPPAGELTDRHLLERFVRRHEQEAFATLAERHGPMVLAVSRRILGDVHAADDAFQATFLILAQKAASVHWHESVGSWLHEVAYRVAQKAKVDAARRRAHERQVPDVSPATPTADVDRRELRALLDEELTHLPEKYRQPLVLCYLEGKTNEEAAQLLGWTKGTVSGQLARARDALRIRLARRGIALSAPLFGGVLSENAAPAAVPAALLNCTIKAALLTPAAKAAAAGAVSAPVAALAEGVLQAMFVTKLNMAALILLALGLLGTGAGFVTYQTLAGRSSGALGSKVPMLAEELKAVSEPKASEPVVKDGLSITVKPAKAGFAEKEPLVFTVTFKNESKRGLLLYDIDWRGAHPEMRIEPGPAGKAKAWVPFSLVEVSRAAPTPERSKLLKPGESREARIDLSRVFYSWTRAQGDPLVPERRDHLAAGKYDLVVDMRFDENPTAPPGGWADRHWAGVLTSKVAFAIGDEKPVAPAPKASEPVVKDGLSVTVKPVKMVFEAKEALSFTVTFKNESKEAFMLYTYGWSLNLGPYTVQINAVPPQWPWVPVSQRKIDQQPPAPTDSQALEPGASLELPIVLDNDLYLLPSELKIKYQPQRFLEKGKYQAVVQLKFVGNPTRDKMSKQWLGDISSKPASFEISDKITELSPAAIERTKLLKDSIDKFYLSLDYYGPGDKRYYRLHLQTAELSERERRLIDGFDQKVQLTKLDAEKLIDHLAAEGFLERVNNKALKKWGPPAGPTYTLAIGGPEQVDWHQDLGWGEILRPRLLSLRNGLPGDAAKKLDQLMPRLGIAAKDDGKAISKPVRVNGVDFEAIAPKRWTIPVAGEKTTVEVGFRITNPSAKELTFNLDDTLHLRIMSADGNELEAQYVSLRNRRVPPMVIAAGGSETVSWRGELAWLPDGKTLRLSGGDGSGGVWSFAGLKAGKYGLSYSYENSEDKPGWWQGKVHTEAAEIELINATAGLSVPDALKQLAAGKGDLEALTVTCNDLHPFHGGLRLVINGNGKVEQEVGRNDKAAQTKIVTRDELMKLAALLVKNEAWDQKVPERVAKPDESRAVLTIKYGTQETTIWEWYNDLGKNARLGVVRDAMKKCALK